MEDGIVDINEMRLKRITDAIRKDNELDEEMKTDLYMFLGSLEGCRKAMEILRKR